MRRFNKALLALFLGTVAAALESAPARVVIPLIANSSLHHPTTVTVESLVITDQRKLVSDANLMGGADLPVELGVLIDTSRSQRDYHLDETVKAMREFVDGLIIGRDDRVFFLEFNETVKATGWLNNEKLKTFTVKVGIGGGTALYDAIEMACRQRMGPRDWRKPTRRILVLISDGDDNLSHLTRDRAVSDALSASAVIFTVNTENSAIPGKGEKVMEMFAKLTGGESFNQISRSEMPKVFANIRGLIDSMYYLSYVPPDVSSSAVHEVEVKPAAKQKFQVSYPAKYVWNP
jgi:VWFA-related protein